MERNDLSVEMKNSVYMKSKITVMMLQAMLWAGSLAAGEKIIQEEKMSFEQCLNVIKEAKINYPLLKKCLTSLMKNSCCFTLSDGKLTILCDGKGACNSVNQNELINTYNIINRNMTTYFLLH